MHFSADRIPAAATYFGEHVLQPEDEPAPKLVNGYAESLRKEKAMRSLMLIFVFGSLCVHHTSSLTSAGEAASASLQPEIRDFAGLCVQFGIRKGLSHELAENPHLIVHSLDPRADVVEQFRRWCLQADARATVVAEHWRRPVLPHADNIVNVLIVEDSSAIDRREAMRVVSPGGRAYFREGDSYRRVDKPRPAEIDEWTHQWQAADGALTSRDQQVGVPQGIRWLAGPLFAMAGRKSSTQSLVSAGGRNFYVTQNVLENIGRPEMLQYLVARDAFNGVVLWQKHWTGPFVTGNGETNPRLAASSDRLYIVGTNAVAALDARNGEEIARTPADRASDKLALADQLVLVQSPGGVTAFERDLDSIRWEFRDRTTTGMVVANDQVLLLVTGRSADGAFQHDLVCLNLKSGEPVWRTNTQPQVSASRLRINFANGEFVALQSHGFLHLYSAADGRHLWSQTTDARPGKTYVDERFVGHFFQHGLVWMLRENSPRESEGQNVWVGLDPHTGEIERELRTTGSWPRTATPAKMGCQLLIASDRFIMIPRQATFIDFETGAKLPFKFTRGGCGLGFVPANGLVYSHPHACGCFSEAVRGFMGMHADVAPPYEPADERRLAAGSTAGVLDRTEAPASDWPMHRRDVQRSAYSPTTLPNTLQPIWKARIATPRDTISQRAWRLRSGNSVSAATVSGDTVFVADVDQGRLLALDTASGDVRWTFAAAGRIDSPPTIYRGHCLFGAHDGNVYCLRAADGRSIWKYRAAPIERRIVAFGGVESIWPVAGTVLIQDGVALIAAGRAPDADGGIEVHALDPADGRPLWSQRVGGGEFVGLCDFLVGGREHAYLSNWRFAPRSGENGQAAPDSGHLRGGKVGLLEASWTAHELALRKEIQTWTAGGASGQLLAFSPTVDVSYHAATRTIQSSGACEWSYEIAAAGQVAAIVLTQSHVVAAAAKDRTRPNAGGVLMLLDASTGSIDFSAELPESPAFDGLTVAGECVYVATQDGQLHCFATPAR